MPRDASGTYTLPINSFYPAQPNTDIDPNDAIETLQDIAGGVTNSALPDLSNIPAASVRPAQLAFDPAGLAGAAVVDGTNTAGFKQQRAAWKYVVDGYAQGDAFHRTNDLIGITDTEAADGHPRIGQQITIVSPGMGRSATVPNPAPGTPAYAEAPQNSRVALSILHYQENWLTNTNGGQADGFQFISRQGQYMDGSAILSQVLFRGGYQAGFEHYTALVDGGGDPTKALTIQGGQVDEAGSGTSSGFHVVAEAGVTDFAYSTDVGAGASYSFLLHMNSNSNSIGIFVDGAGDTSIGGALTVITEPTAMLPSAASRSFGEIRVLTDGDGGNPCLAVNTYGSSGSPGWQRIRLGAAPNVTPGE